MTINTLEKLALNVQKNSQLTFENFVNYKKAKLWRICNHEWKDDEMVIPYTDESVCISYCKKCGLTSEDSINQGIISNL